MDETDAFVDNTNMTRVLVRNKDGQLVRTTAQPPYLRRMSSKPALVREVDPSRMMSTNDIPNLEIRPQALLTRQASSTSSKAPSISDPLITFNFLEDMEAGRAADDANKDDGAHNSGIGSSNNEPKGDFQASDSRPNPLISERQPQTASYPNMQYATIPGHSMLSLIGEDDNVMPEDCAIFAPEYRRTSTRPGTSGDIGDYLDDPQGSRHLKVRPLPDDASDERVVQIPPRLRSSSSRRGDRRSSKHLKMSSFGAVSEVAASSQNPSGEMRSMSDYGSSRNPSVEWR